MSHDPYEAPEVNHRMVPLHPEVVEIDGRFMLALKSEGFTVAYLSEHDLYRGFLDVRNARYARDPVQAEREDREALVEADRMSMMAELKARAAK